MAILAPIPKANDKIATAAKLGLFFRMRRAWRTSCVSVSSQWSTNQYLSGYSGNFCTEQQQRSISVIRGPFTFLG
jgi:hypothetical protein